MSRATLIVDGRTELDEDVTPGQKQPPQILADMIKPGAKKRPYMMAAAAALAEAVVLGKPVEINITTRPTGWTVDVSHTHALTAGGQP